MQALNVKMPQLHSAFAQGKQLTPRAGNVRPAFSRAAVVPKAIFGNKQKQPSITKPTSGKKYGGKGYENPTPTSAFTRKREIIAGRAAMAGFVAALIGEFLTGRGALGQLQLETRLPQNVIDLLTLGLVGFNFLTALGPGSATFDPQNQADVKKRGKSATQGRLSLADNPRKFFGIDESGFGFTKRNELFVGRVAMLGFASELIGEKLSGGKGPLGQLGLPINAAAQGYEIVALGIWVGFFLVAAVGFGNYGEQEGSEEVF